MQFENISEASIGPPKFPLVTSINASVLGWVFERFKAKYLPAYNVVVTSEYRDPAKNREVGGAENSAHVHHLARDFVLYRKDGTALTKPEARRVFDEFVKPHWPGYSLFEEDAGAKPSGYHVHVNLSRRITTYSGLLAAGVLAFGAYKFFEEWRNGKS